MTILRECFVGGRGSGQVNCSRLRKRSTQGNFPQGYIVILLAPDNNKTCLKSSLVRDSGTENFKVSLPEIG